MWTVLGFFGDKTNFFAVVFSLIWVCYSFVASNRSLLLTTDCLKTIAPIQKQLFVNVFLK